MRDIRGKAVKSREAMPPQKRPKDENTEGGNAKEASGDRVNKASERRAPEAFEAHISRLEEHHDRLDSIEKQLGIHHGADNMKSEDQSKMGKGKEAGHITEKKGTAKFGRKHN